TTTGFVINDPAFSGNDGFHREVRPEQILKAWSDATIVHQAAAFLPPNGKTGLSLANLPNPALSAVGPTELPALPIRAASAALQLNTLAPPPPPPSFAQLALAATTLPTVT